MGHGHHHAKEKRTLWVVLLTAITMVVEIIFGLLSGSMALLADGIHMGSHVLAIGLAWIAYIIVRRVSKSDKFKGDSDKILSLSGYSSGLILLIFAFVIMFEAIKRLYNPIEISYIEAMSVATIGLFVNIISAFLLHTDKSHSDHNIRAAYLHVIADALTSLTAIIGLGAAMIWDLVFVDAIAALLSSLIIIRWSVGLLKDSGSSLLNMDADSQHHQ
ncbi:MAG: cation diffusion facilitator family transporter [Bacteroidales bacterium]|nr:cation diffusion facilitator family transporter [Bacteroidales bacterium]